MKRFSGKVALVTGGASGIGRAALDRFVAEDAKVIAWDVNAKKLAACAEAHGNNVLTQQVDVTDADAVGRALDQAIQHFGRLDILVNGAGIIGPNGPFWDISPEDWNKVLNVNLTSAFLVCRAAVGHLKAHGCGRIVNVASVTANEGPKNLGAYAASKAGMVGLTKSMGKELAETGVLVNAIAPALIETEIMKQLTPEYKEKALARVPMGRPGSLDEAAAMITWICSDECSFSTGAVFDLSGGRGV